jgi:biopolymer transport protein ExbB
MSLVGAEWVLYLLVALSILSVTLIFERALFYRAASKNLTEFRRNIRESAMNEKWDDAIRTAETRMNQQEKHGMDLECEMALALLRRTRANSKQSTEALAELGRDAMMRAKIGWDRNLSLLATIGSNAPFIGLFGTVLGIIKAFHDLANQSGTGPQTVSTGISEALVATAVGLLVAIPAVIAFNLFQRKVKRAAAEAEALKSFLIFKLSE